MERTNLQYGIILREKMQEHPNLGRRKGLAYILFKLPVLTQRIRAYINFDQTKLVLSFFLCPLLTWHELGVVIQGHWSSNPL